MAPLQLTTPYISAYGTGMSLANVNVCGMTNTGMMYGIVVEMMKWPGLYTKLVS